MGSDHAEGIEAVLERFPLEDVLSIETMLDDLRRWPPPEWREHVAQLRGWSAELFDALL